METQAQKPRYRVSFLTPQQLDQKRKSGIEGWYYIINENIGKHTFISKI